MCHQFLPLFYLTVYQCGDVSDGTRPVLIRVKVHHPFLIQLRPHGNRTFQSASLYWRQDLVHQGFVINVTWGRRGLWWHLSTERWCERERWFIERGANFMCKIHESDWKGRSQTFTFCHHVFAFVIFGVCLSIPDFCGAELRLDAHFEALLNPPLCQICRATTGETRQSRACRVMRFKRGGGGLYFSPWWHLGWGHRPARIRHPISHSWCSGFRSPPGRRSRCPSHIPWAKI